MVKSNIFNYFVFVQILFVLSNAHSANLFLTPYIKAGQLEEARNASKVNGLGGVESYSGYFTVNEKHGSNLFFWFFPAQSGKKDVPLVLWLQGGPGTSSLFGLFVENGPFAVDEKLALSRRKYSWTQNHSVIYIDSPVGSGFSFTENENGYSKSQDEVAFNLYESLTQFFKLFPDFQSADFFITGESYAGKFVPTLSLKIHNENLNHPSVYINYKGMAIGAGFSDPISMVDSYGEYFNNMGLIDENARKHFDEIGEDTKAHILAGNYSRAYQLQDELLGGDDLAYPTFFKNKTGYDFYFNVLQAKQPDDNTYYIKFVQQDYVRQAIHVGNTTFFNQSLLVPKFLKDDIFKSVKPTVELLINLKYKVLLYVGQFDMIVPHLAVRKFIENMDWIGKSDFVKADRKVWVLGDEVTGYVKQSENVIFVIIRNAGHNAPHDTPRSCFKLISSFTRGLDLIQ